MALLILAFLASDMPASAQSAPQQPKPEQPKPEQPKPADPKLIAAQSAFEALPEAERKGIQNDLVWATRFNGAAAGTFGPLTYNAVLGFEREKKLEADGILQPPERQVLAGAANAARAAAKFGVIADGRSGARLGVPAGLLVKQEANTSGGSRWQDQQGKVTLDTQVIPAGETLEALFDRATSANVPGRKITYKLLRPDFFVVTGETAAGRFYRRVAKAPDGALRGFSIGYDKALAPSVDRYVIAIANTFDPFPDPATAAAATIVPRPVPSQAPTPAAPARPRERLLTGLAVAPGLIATSAEAARACANPRVVSRPGGRPVVGRLDRADASSGLALIAADGVAAPAPLPVRAESAAVTEGIAFFHGETGPVAVPVDIVAGAPRLIVGALQPGAAGGLVFDRTGALIGLITADPSARMRVAGVVPAARYRFAEGAALVNLLGAAAEAPRGGALTTGEIALAAKTRPIPITCVP